MIYNTPLVSQIVAIGENREMGKDNDLPWGRALPTDMKRFRDKIRGHTIISGRRTFESMGAKPLPNRANIIVTREEDYKPEGARLPSPGGKATGGQVIVVHSFEDAIAEARKTEKEEIFVIGGGQIFTAAMPYTDKIYLTLIHAKFPDADTFFPEYPDFKKVVYREEVFENGYNYEFLDLVR